MNNQSILAPQEPQKGLLDLRGAPQARQTWPEAGRPWGAAGRPWGCW